MACDPPSDPTRGPGLAVMKIHIILHTDNSAIITRSIVGEQEQWVGYVGPRTTSLRKAG